MPRMNEIRLRSASAFFEKEFRRLVQKGINDFESLGYCCLKR